MAVLLVPVVLQDTVVVSEASLRADMVVKQGDMAVQVVDMVVAD